MCLVTLNYMNLMRNKRREERGKRKEQRAKIKDQRPKSSYMLSLSFSLHLRFKILL